MHGTKKYLHSFGFIGNHSKLNFRRVFRIFFKSNLLAIFFNFKPFSEFQRQRFLLLTPKFLTFIASFRKK